MYWLWSCLLCRENGHMRSGGQNFCTRQCTYQGKIFKVQITRTWYNQQWAYLFDTLCACCTRSCVCIMLMQSCRVAVGWDLKSLLRHSVLKINRGYESSLQARVHVTKINFLNTVYLITCYLFIFCLVFKNLLIYLTIIQKYQLM